MVPGLFARIKIGGGGKNSVVMANERAISTDQNKKFVYVVGNDNTVAYREVKLGPTYNGLRVIREGLSAGEKIVINGLQRVRPGAPVQPQMVSMETGQSATASVAPTNAPVTAESKPESEPNQASSMPDAPDSDKPAAKNDQPAQ